MTGGRESTGTREEWYRFGERDLQAARLLIGQEGMAGIVAVLAQQAVEKYLKGYLIGLGWELKKTHDLELLVSEAAAHDISFAQFLELARSLSAYYVRERYPPGPTMEYRGGEIAQMLAQAERMIARIREANGLG